MKGNGWVRLIFSAVVQSVITTGTALTVAISAGPITKTTWSLAVIGGLVAAAKDVQAHLAEPPK